MIRRRFWSIFAYWGLVFEVPSSNQPHEELSGIDSSMNQVSFLQNGVFFCSFLVSLGHPVPDGQFVFFSPSEIAAMIVIGKSAAGFGWHSVIRRIDYFVCTESGHAHEMKIVKIVRGHVCHREAHQREKALFNHIFQNVQMLIFFNSGTRLGISIGAVTIP